LIPTLKIRQLCGIIVHIITGKTAVIELRETLVERAVRRVVLEEGEMT
jgi:hypothetical protein